jgi:hypothetical protein
MRSDWLPHGDAVVRIDLGAVSGEKPAAGANHWVLGMVIRWIIVTVKYNERKQNFYFVCSEQSKYSSRMLSNFFC